MYVLYWSLIPEPVERNHHNQNSTAHHEDLQLNHRQNYYHNFTVKCTWCRFTNIEDTVLDTIECWNSVISIVENPILLEKPNDNNPSMWNPCLIQRLNYTEDLMIQESIFHWGVHIGGSNIDNIEGDVPGGWLQTHFPFPPALYTIATSSFASLKQVPIMCIFH